MAENAESVTLMRCDNCDEELTPPVEPSGHRFHITGSYACQPFDEDGQSIAGTVAAPQPADAAPPSIWDGTLDVMSVEGQRQLAQGYPDGGEGVNDE